METTKTYDKGKVKTVVITFMTLAVIGLTIAVIILANNNRKQNYDLENSYQRSFYELVDANNNLELNLSKLMVSVTDSQNSVLAMQTYRQAESAMDSLTRLPLDKGEIMEVEKFYNQVSDWCMSYNKALAKSSDTTSYKDSLEDLYIAAAQINELLKKESELLAEHNFSIKSLAKFHNDEFKRRDFTATSERSEKKNITVDYPQLIYDGPFSESTSQRCYKALEDLEEISKEAAEDIIRKSLPYNVSEINFLGTSGGMAPSYEFSLSTGSGDVYCLITVNGGKFLNINCYKQVNTVSLKQEQAQEKAASYAKELGFDVEPVWYNETEGIAYVNLAPVKDDITYYTDLVKVKIALDEGMLLGLETTGFCMNNCERDVSPLMTADSAVSQVSKKLTIKDSRLALVPDGEKEVLCYQISAEYKGLDYFIYIDANSGKEINIMRVIDREQGSMVM